MLVAAGGPRVGVAEAVMDVVEGAAGVADERGIGVAQHVRAHRHVDPGGLVEPAEQPPDRAAGPSDGHPG